MVGKALVGRIHLQLNRNVPFKIFKLFRNSQDGLTTSKKPSTTDETFLLLF